MSPRTLLAATVATALAVPALAQEPRLSNGRLQRHSVATGLAAEVRGLVAAATTPEWIGYAVPADRPREMCCYESWNGEQGCAGCWLEGRREGGAATAPAPAPDGPVRLEGSDSMLVLLRAEKGAVGRIRTVSLACPLDAGGLTLHWYGSADPEQSLRLLASFVPEQDTARATLRVGDGALHAIATHAHPGAIDWLVRRAKESPSRHVRGQSLFWLGQRAGERAVPAITRAIEDDPDTEVKRKAVFALSQLPKDEGVPLLIQTARGNKNLEVRRQAFFWLGQSKDPRALAFFEEVLR